MTRRRDPLSAREMLEELRADPKSECHWVRHRGRLLIAVRDATGAIRSFDCGIYGEACEEGPRT